MGIAFDKATTLALGTGTRNFTHTPVGTPKGAIVIVVDGVGTDQVTSVTYGGTTMTQVTGSPNLQSGGEAGSVHAFYLGASIPTGAQTVTVTRGDATNYIAVCYTVTADGDTYIHNVQTSSSTATAAPGATLTITEPSFVAGGLYSGVNNPNSTAPTGTANDLTGDFGTDTAAIASSGTDGTPIKTSNFAFNWSQGSDDGTTIVIAMAQKLKLKASQVQATIKLLNQNQFAQAGAVLPPKSCWGQTQAKIIATLLYVSQSQARIFPKPTNNYEVEVLTDIPNFLLPMSESSGNLTDVVGLRTATANGSPTYSVSGPISGKTAIDFNTFNDYFTVSDDSGLDLGDGPLTVELWYARESDPGQWHVLLAKGANAYGLGIDSVDKYSFTKSEVSQLAYGSTSATSDGSWHHIVATRSATRGAGSTIIYLDGVEDSTTEPGSQLSTTLSDTNLALTIGRENASTAEPALGRIAYVALYPSVLSATRILAHFNAALSSGRQFAQTQARILNPKTYYISPSGHDDTGDGTSGTPWRTLGKFYAQANPGDILYCRGGTYADDTEVIVTNDAFSDYPITVRNYVGETPVFSNTTYDGQFLLFNSGASHHIVDGLTFNSSIITAVSSFLWVGNGTSVSSGPPTTGPITFRNCTINKLAGSANGVHGFYISWWAVDVTIEDCVINGRYSQDADNSAGIEIYHDPAANNTTIKRCIVNNWANGIQIWDSAGTPTATATITHNTLVNNDVHIDARYHSTITIRDNAGDSPGSGWSIYDPNNSADTTADHNFWAQTFDSEYHLLYNQTGKKAASDGTDAGVFNYDLVWAQAQATITGAASKYQFSQAQTKVNAFNVNSFAQGQANIKQTYRGYSQAQGDIKQTSRGYSQAQSDIKQSYQGYSQAQSDVKATNRGYAQVQASIKAVSRWVAQSQTDIKATNNSVAQANAKIKSIGWDQWAQAQVDIKATSLRVSQAQGDIKQTSRGYAQSQAGIKQTSSVFAQAQSDIKQTSSVFAQVQAKIIPTRVFAQSQAAIKAIGYGFAQAQPKIKSIGWDQWAQVQTDIKATSRGYSQAQSDIKQTYSPVAQANSGIKATSSVVAQTQTWIKQITAQVSQAQAKIALPTTTIYAQSQAGIKQTYFVFAQVQSDIKQTYVVVSQAQAKISTTRVFAQAQSDIKAISSVFAQANVYIKAINLEGFAQAQTDIRQTYSAFAQASVWIKSSYQGYTQAQSAIKQIYSQVAQAQVKISTTRQYAQVQSDIKATYIQVSQVRADIKATSSQFAQAQGSIATTQFRFSQAQSNIKAVSSIWAQAQTDIKQTYTVVSQAQSDIKQTYSVVVQVQADIKAISRGYAQARADIKAVNSVFVQANADIKATSNSFAQVQADIKQTYAVFANAQADIKQIYNGFAQAQTWIKTTNIVAVVQAQTDILATSNSFAQAQARLIAFDINGFAQAQTYISMPGVTYAQAQANIKATTSNFAQAQARIYTPQFTRPVADESNTGWIRVVI